MLLVNEAVVIDIPPDTVAVPDVKGKDPPVEFVFPAVVMTPVAFTTDCVSRLALVPPPALVP